MPDFLSEFSYFAKKGYLSERRLNRVVNVATHRQRGLMVIMEDVHNPHNLAAIARSCDAFGIQQIAFTMENENLFDPLGVGKISSANASKWLDYRIFENGTRDALTTLKNEGWHIMATWVNPEARSIHEIDFTPYDKLALLFGNEHAGISQTAIELADSYLYIPMMGMTESFNVSVAVALSLFEITHQRLASEKDFFLPEDEARKLIADFAMRAIPPKHRKYVKNESE
jgi:tRNA (guanosine-2'-O-)-methyltransferase